MPLPAVVLLAPALAWVGREIWAGVRYMGRVVATLWAAFWWIIGGTVSMLLALPLLIPALLVPVGLLVATVITMATDKIAIEGATSSFNAFTTRPVVIGLLKLMSALNVILPVSEYMAFGVLLGGCRLGSQLVRIARKTAGYVSPLGIGDNG